MSPPVPILCNILLRLAAYPCPAKPQVSSFTLHWSSSVSCMNKYLAIDSGGYVWISMFYPLIAVWMNASHRSHDGVVLNRSAREI